MNRLLIIFCFLQSICVSSQHVLLVDDIRTTLPYIPISDYVGKLGVSYSVRLNNYGYDGPCMRVVNSSTSLEQDIYYDSTGYIDTVAIKSFIGPNVGYVKVWYDSNGTGLNATQSTQALMPLITNSSGDFFYSGGHVSVRFQGDYLVLQSFPGYSTAHIFARIEIDNDPPPGSQTGIWYFGTFTDSDHYPWSDGRIYMAWAFTIRRNFGNPSTSLAQSNVFEVGVEPSGHYGYLNGNSIFSLTGSGSPAWITSPLIGKSKGSYYLYGNINEILIWREIKLSERGEIYDNIINFFEP